MRNLLVQVPKQAQTMVSALVRTIFQPKAREELGPVADHFAERFPKAAALLADAEDDVLAYTGFPREPLRAAESGN